MPTGFAQRESYQSLVEFRVWPSRKDGAQTRAWQAVAEQTARDAYPVRAPEGLDQPCWVVDRKVLRWVEYFRKDPSRLCNKS